MKILQMKILLALGMFVLVVLGSNGNHLGNCNGHDKTANVGCVDGGSSNGGD